MSKQIEFDLSKLKISWTKYDIVQVMDVISSEDKIDKYKKKKLSIDEPILRKFLGIKKLTDPTPSYWLKIQDYPKHKKTFALLALLFTHGRIINDFINIYSNINRGGVFLFQAKEKNRKEQTNIRSALVEAGVASPKNRRSDEVPYNFSEIFTNGSVGSLFKQILEERITRVTKNEITQKQFYSISRENNFHKALGLSFEEFYSWLEGNDLELAIVSNNKWLKEVKINSFYSIKKATLDFSNSNEIYLLGENGDGKSLVLMATYLAFRGYYIKNIANSEPVAKVLDIIKKLKPNSLSGVDCTDCEYEIDIPLSISNFFAYGTHRGRYSTDKAEKYGFMSLFSIDEQLHNPETWLMQQKAIEIEKNHITKNNTGDLNLYPTHFSVTFLENLLNELLEKSVEVQVGVSKVIFKERGQSITFDKLSEGYRSVIIFVIDLMIRLVKNTNGEQIKDLQHIKGVVLIDEIDQHLHPRWQKEIVSRLRSIFPQVQFIMTTHSPTIIQGASDEAIIFRVYRDRDTGETKVSEPIFRKDLDHLMINTLITHPIFGLETARMDEKYEDADTSDDYLQYRISRKIREELEKKRKAGANFITEQEIDDLINEIIKKEMGR